MTAGRGWIALALVVFATWKPWRVLAGAYLFGGVTLAQFQAQALGVDDPVAVPVDAAVRRDDRRARDHLARRDRDPPQRAGVARQAVPPGRPERARANRRFGNMPDSPPPARVARSPRRHPMSTHHPQNALAALAAGALAAPSRCPPPRTRRRRAAQDRLRLREPDRRRRLDVPARHRPQGNGKGARRQGHDQVHRERAGRRRRRARDPRARAKRPQAHLHDVVRLHEPDDQGRAGSSRRRTSSTRPATRRRRTSASTTRASTKAAISPASSPAR